MLTLKALQISKTLSRMEGLDLQNQLDTLKSLEHIHKSTCQTNRFTQVFLVEVAKVWEECLQVKLHSRRNPLIRKKEWLSNIHQVVVVWTKWTALDKEMLWYSKWIQLSLWSTQWRRTTKIMRLWLILDKWSTRAIMMDLVKLRKGMVMWDCQEPDQ